MMCSSMNFCKLLKRLICTKLTCRRIVSVLLKYTILTELNTSPWVHYCSEQMNLDYKAEVYDLVEIVL